MSADALLEVGKITGAFGVRGWVKVWSYTDPLENLLEYSPWQVKVGGEWKVLKVKDGHAQGRGLVAQLEGVDDRNQAELLMQAPIFVARAQMRVNDDKDGFYWTDLEGCEVVNEDGVSLGKIVHLFENGANHVMVVSDGTTERMIPWVIDALVKAVDLQAKRICVAWQADW